MRDSKPTIEARLPITANLLRACSNKKAQHNMRICRHPRTTSVRNVSCDPRLRSLTTAEGPCASLLTPASTRTATSASYSAASIENPREKQPIWSRQEQKHTYHRRKPSRSNVVCQRAIVGSTRIEPYIAGSQPPKTLEHWLRTALTLWERGLTIFSIDLDSDVLGHW